MAAHPETLRVIQTVYDTLHTVVRDTGVAHAMVVAAEVQAACAFVTVGVMVWLALITRSYARDTKRMAQETKRMADAVVRELELKVAPLLEFEVPDNKMKSIKWWEDAGVPVDVHNVGVYPATIVTATLEFRAASPTSTPLTVPVRTNTPISVNPDENRELDVVIPLSRIPPNERPARQPGTPLVTFRVRYVVHGVTGVDVERHSREFTLRG